MLDELRVRNLGVLEEAWLEPGPAFTVITGETGAGKTLLLGALRLLLGAAADSDLVGPFGDEAHVEGRFLADGREVAAGRRLSRHGRSRAYLDGSIASAAALDEATAGLVEIVGQHDQLSLTRASEVRAAIDRMMDDEGRRGVEAYRECWQRWRELIAAQEALGGDLGALERELDLVSFQAEEIARAKLREGEDEELESRLGRLRNAEELRELLAHGFAELERAREAVGEAVASIRRAAALDRGLAGLEQAVEGLEAALGEAVIDARRAGDDLETDPDQLEAAERRLQTISDLRRKYGPSLADVVRFGQEAERRREEIGRLLQRSGRLAGDIEEARSALERQGEELRRARSEAAARLSAEATAHLLELGFSSPLLEARVEAAEPAAWGADSSLLLFASDRRLTPAEIGKAASGGELSRLVLALRLSGGGGSAPCLVFDEVDAGVGGATAIALGRKLSSLAEGRQVLCVTHLPQVAAFADTHYVVRRSEAKAVVERAEGDARVEELSRMLAGLPDSERGKDAAKELLALVAST